MAWNCFKKLQIVTCRYKLLKVATSKYKYEKDVESKIVFGWWLSSRYLILSKIGGSIFFFMANGWPHNNPPSYLCKRVREVIKLIVLGLLNLGSPALTSAHLQCLDAFSICFFFTFFCLSILYMDTVNLGLLTTVDRISSCTWCLGTIFLF